MFCKHCGNEFLSDRAVYCVKCGAPKNAGTSYCSTCGNPIQENASICTNCGVPVNSSFRTGPKSRIAAGVLAIFLGWLGIHNFYLGFNDKGLTQLLVTLVGGILTCGIASLVIQIWAIVEAIQIFTGTINADANGIPLND